MSTAANADRAACSSWLIRSGDSTSPRRYTTPCCEFTEASSYNSSDQDLLTAFLDRPLAAESESPKADLAR